MSFLQPYIDFYRSLGLHVIPVIYGTKAQPAIKWKRFQRDPPTDKEIAEWFKDRANIAIVGGTGGFVALDFDDMEIYNRFFEGENIEGRTIVIVTGRGRRHVYLRSENPVSFEIPELKLEVKGQGRYIIAPPSLHPSGGIYKFAFASSVLFEVKDIEAYVWERAERLGVKRPPDLIQEEKEEGKKRSPYTGPDPPCIERLSQGVEEGYRNLAAIRIASFLCLVRGIVDKDKLLKALKKWNHQNKPPLSEDELQFLTQSELEGRYRYGCRSLQNFCDQDRCVFAWRKICRQRADDLRKDPGLLYKIKCLQDKMVVGEDENKLLLFLIMLSKDLDDPLCAILKASSSSGKSYLVNSTLKLFPREMYEKVSRVTPAALDYVRDRLMHKIFFVQELGGAMAGQASLNVSLTEKELVLWLPTRSQGGDYTIKEVHARGPTCFISTTVEMVVDEQLETRTWALSVDESEEQTRRIHEFQALLDMKPWLVEEQGRAAQVIQNIVIGGSHSPISVIVPFSDKISFPTGDRRTRRDRPKFLSLIKAVAYLYQGQRPMVTHQGKDYIVAFPIDFYMALEVGMKTLKETLLKLPRSLQETLEICGKLEREGELITNKNVAKRMNFTTSSASRYLNDLNDLGYVSLIQGGRGALKVYEVINTNDGRNLSVSSAPVSFEDYVKALVTCFDGDLDIVSKAREYEKYYYNYTSPLTGETKSLPKPSAA